MQCFTVATINKNWWWIKRFERDAFFLPLPVRQSKASVCAGSQKTQIHKLMNSFGLQPLFKPMFKAGTKICWSVGTIRRWSTKLMQWTFCKPIFFHSAWLLTWQPASRRSKHIGMERIEIIRSKSEWKRWDLHLDIMPCAWKLSY